MAEIQVTVEKIHEIKEHPNADRLEIAVIGGDGGYHCCVQKGAFLEGDKCVYFPVDSVLPEYLENAIFGEDSKVKLSKSRVKTIKLRGAISQGLAVPVHALCTIDGYQYLTEGIKVGADLTKLFGVTKYEPPQSGSPTSGTKPSTARNINPYFDKYTDINHLKKYPEVLKGKKVVAYEKIHGTNFRAGWVKAYPRTLFQRLLKRFGLLKKWQFVYGSHNVQLQGKYKGNDFYSNKTDVDVYTKIVRQYDLINRLKPGEVIYGEIYGDKIQKNYTYGCGPGEHKLAVFDLKVNGNFVNVKSLVTWGILNNFDIPPMVYCGEFNMVDLDSAVQGPSRLSGGHIREGIVVRPQEEEYAHCGRVIFKYINPEYLLKEDSTEYH